MPTAPRSAQPATDPGWSGAARPAGEPTLESVYVLWHVRADDAYADDAKLIGIYRSETSALAAAERLRPRPGFRDHPTGFQVSCYRLDRDHWAEGFVVA